MEQVFRPVRHKLVYEEVVDEILARIQSGELVVGQKLPPERALSQELGVSRTSLREALRTLESMGYLRSEVGGGNYVNEVGLEHVLPPLNAMMAQDRQLAADIIDVRRCLEVQTAALAAKKASKSQVMRIYGAILDMQADIEKGGNGEGGDNAFHLEIARASGNRGFATIVELCNDLVAESQRATLGIPGQPAKTVEDHQRIFEAIRDGDAQGAAREMGRHLDKALRNLEHSAKAMGEEEKG